MDGHLLLLRYDNAIIEWEGKHLFFVPENGITRYVKIRWPVRTGWRVRKPKKWLEGRIEGVDYAIVHYVRTLDI